MGHDNFGCARPLIAGSICHAEENRIDAAVAVAFTLRAQLDGLAVGCDHDVICGVPIAVAVLDLITSHLRDDDVAHWDGAITVVVNACHKARHQEVLILVIRRPHCLRRGDGERWRFVVHHGDGLGTTGVVAGTIRRRPGDGRRSFRIRRIHSLAITARTGKGWVIAVVSRRGLARIDRGRARSRIVALDYRRRANNHRVFMILHRNRLRARRLVGWTRMIRRGPGDCGCALRIRISQRSTVTARSRNSRITVAVIRRRRRSRIHMSSTRAWLGVGSYTRRAMNRWRGCVFDSERDVLCRNVAGTIIGRVRNAVRTRTAGVVIRFQMDCVRSNPDHRTRGGGLSYGDALPAATIL